VGPADGTSPKFGIRRVGTVEDAKFPDDDSVAEARLESKIQVAPAAVLALINIRAAKATARVRRCRVYRGRTPSGEDGDIWIHSSHRRKAGLYELIYDLAPVGALNLVGTWDVDAAAVGVVRIEPGRKRETIEVVGPEARSFPWASVTKPVIALAVLVAVEEGTLSLDLPVGPPGSTVRHLLAHASGLAPDVAPGLGSSQPGHLPEPGTRRIYSNLGYERLAEAVAEHSGMPFHDYVVAAVFEPLGMSATGFTLRPTDSVPGNSGAAAGLAGPLRDLLAVVAEWSAPTLIGSETHALATSVAFPGLAGVLPGFGRFDPCDWGLGVEIRGHKQPHWTGTLNSPGTFGHFGQSGSFFWVDPDAGLACAGLADRAFGPWAITGWPMLSDAVLAEFEDP
jgi:CubicO group peptidase (beta-lactamase class C family)